MGYISYCILNLFYFMFILIEKYIVLQVICYIIVIYALLYLIAFIDKRILNKKIYNFIVKKLK